MLSDVMERMPLREYRQWCAQLALEAIEGGRDAG